MRVIEFLSAWLVLAAAGRASAQQPAPVTPAGQVADSLKARSASSGNTIKGYAKAEIVGPDGKLSHPYVLVEPGGVAQFLLFYRREDEVRRFGSEPFSIDVDNVKSLKVNGLYQEHIILKGKRKHLLATRLVEGPVELFHFAQEPQSGSMGGGGGMMMGAYRTAAISRWYLRREGGELVEVNRTEFITQMTHYFHDDPGTMALLMQRKLGYSDMVKVVQGYNEYRTQAAAK
jgi:hypothetical protein